MAKLRDREVLNLFVEFVDQLVDSSLVDHIKQQGISTTLAIRPGGFCTLAKAGPSDEALKSVLLTVRLFGQNNDQVSFNNLDAAIQKLDIPQVLKDKFTTIRGKFNSYLHGPLNIPVEGCGADTRHDVFDKIIYGTYSHINPVKYRQVQEWKRRPFYHDIAAQFDLIAFEYIRAAAAMADVVREILKLDFEAGANNPKPTP